MSISSDGEYAHEVNQNSGRYFVYEIMSSSERNEWEKVENQDLLRNPWSGR